MTWLIGGKPDEAWNIEKCLSALSDDTESRSNEQEQCYIMYTHTEVAGALVLGV